MQLTATQYRLMLEAEINCFNCLKHMDTLAFDVLPHTEPLAGLQIDWYLASKQVYLD